VSLPWISRDPEFLSGDQAGSSRRKGSCAEDVKGVSMADEAESSGGKEKKEENVGDLLGRLHLEEDEVEDFFWEDEVAESEVKAKWLAISRVHTSKLGFSQSALFSDMRSAWNPTREVTWRRIEDNLFTVQFNCLADWNKAMH
jgi:hypothetical protein